MELYTIGYQGTDLLTYIQALQEVGVDVLVDVRETAWSYKRGFCKTALSTELAKAGIEYIHLKSAGNPKENRRNSRTMAECLGNYRRHLAKNPAGLHDVLAVVAQARTQKKKVCLTCFEKEHLECHRSILASAVAKHVKQLRQVHLST